MNLAFNLMKMPTAIEQGVIQYFIGTDRQSVNQWIGKRITIQFEGRINCIDCGKLTKKSFGQGFCYTCFMSSTNNAPCIIHPELCEAHLGKGRDPEWEMKKLRDIAEINPKYQQLRSKFSELMLFLPRPMSSCFQAKW